MNLKPNTEHPFLNNVRSCPRCGAEFPNLTFKCKFCGKELIDKNYLK